MSLRLAPLLMPQEPPLSRKVQGADVRSELAAIVEYSNDAIFSRTFEGIITTWNQAAERIFGYSAAEIVGRSSRVLLPPSGADEFRKLMAKLRRGEIVEHFETERIRKDGGRIRVSLTFSPIRGINRELLGFSTIARDITEQAQLREALARRERELEDLFEQASVGLVMLQRNGKILRVNRAFLEVVGCPAKKVIGKRIQRFHADGDLIEKLLRSMADRQTLKNFQTEFRNGKGLTKSVLVDANALWENGRFIHSRWFVRDISQRKRLERELIELTERERRGFAQELHDGLGQQLGGIAYLSNVLHQRLAERRAPEAENAERIFGLVRNAIEQTRRVARGLSPIRAEPEGLMDALRDLAAQTKGLFGVQCRFVCRRLVPVPDPVVAAHLFRIAQEAVNNALKHARPGRIDLMLKRERKRVILAIKDDGRGFRPVAEHRKGLGLRIMQYRAGLIQGVFSVQPRRNGGTEVLCSAPLPAARPGEKSKKAC